MAFSEDCSFGLLQKTVFDQTQEKVGCFNNTHALNISWMVSSTDNEITMVGISYTPEGFQLSSYRGWIVYRISNLKINAPPRLNCNKVYLYTSAYAGSHLKTVIK